MIRLLRRFVLLLLVAPAAAGAQLPSLEGLLKSFSDVSVYYTQAGLARNTPEVKTDKKGLTGFGFELLLTAGARAKDCPAPGSAPHRHRDHDPCAPKSSGGAVAVGGAHSWVGSAALDKCVDAAGLPRDASGSTTGTKDTSVAPTGITIAVKQQPVTGTATESQLTCTMSVEITQPPKKADTTLTIEIGLGYGQFSGFRSKVPDIDLRGAVREFPALSVYGNWEHPIAKVLYPYLGIRTGLVLLQSVRAYVPGSDDLANFYTMGGSSFQLGGVAGTAFRLSGRTNTYLFVEGYYDARTFQSVEWGGGDGKSIPVAAPRRLDLSAWGGTVGLQFPLGLKEAK
jgi:hypothetical protein